VASAGCVAELLIAQVMEWAPVSGVHTLVLHASADGRALHERLGFVPATEMRHVDS
jgi:hypothetical protein